MVARRSHNSGGNVSQPHRSSGKSQEVSLTPEQLQLKRDFQDVVRGVGGVEAGELSCRVGKSQIARYYDPRAEEFVPVDVLADLEPLARHRPGWPHVTRSLARRQGFALLSYPPIEDDAPGGVCAALAETTKDSSAVATGLLNALEDGVFEPAEAARLAPQAMEAAEAMLRLHALLARIAGGS